MKKLIIDTSKREEIFLSLETNNKKSEIRSKESKSSNILPQIIKLLKKNNTKLNEIDQIEINPGPGSFTGIRVGISIANALGAVLKIPVNGKKGKLVDPKYT